jgi:uncharacterized protein YdeI (YjbR/CyaY-like superfamily)
MKTEAENFFEKAQKWNNEFHLLREIICQNKLLQEDYKWMHPCYTYGGKNIVLIHGFKDYCAILFHKGALLNDSKGILIQQTENVQSARQIRFSNTEQIIKLQPVIINYIEEAIEIEKSGKKIALKKAADYPVPFEFQEALDSDKELKQTFYSLTQGRQKGYLFYFNQAKQSETRKKRIEKYYQHILAGKGLED